ncbi:hypothetical protein RJ641_002562 [Dillenia turbinata]|uniref:Uncharacterized protein n=1 Tax=Dillenia turbinata TaxID=194707 RepID=A0AAN8VFJ3_9MAGN
MEMVKKHDSGRLNGSGLSLPLLAKLTPRSVFFGLAARKKISSLDDEQLAQKSPKAKAENNIQVLFRSRKWSDNDIEEI